MKECQAKAKDYLKDVEARRAAGDVVEGGAAGAAVGAVTGAVFGSVGRGAAAGGISGAVLGLFRGIFRTHQPGPARRAYVDRCLREKGFDVIAWE